jgi:DNA-directed RNA polymerase specialized sigma24 family protein
LRMAPKHVENNQVLIDELLLLLEGGQPTPEKRYKQLRLKLVKFFAWRRCQDPEGLADETVSRTVRNIIRGEKIHSDKPYSYVYGIAMNVFREYLREKKKQENLANDLPDSSPYVRDIAEDCRKDCFDRLSSGKRTVLHRYYVDGEASESMALSLNITVNAFRLQIHRIKNELRACYEECTKSGSRRN